MVELKYGSEKIRISIPGKAAVSILQPLRVPVIESVEQALDSALSAPIDCEPLEAFLAGRRPASVAIAVPDETRPAPLGALLPLLLKRIGAALPDPLAEHLTLFIGGGLHPPADATAIDRILPGGITCGCRVAAHDARTAAMRDYGTTTRGTPVRINEAYAAADFKVVIGQVDPHQFVGFTGGSKGVVIGCAAPETIEKNHSLMSQPNAQVGQLKGNPVREDLTEAGEMVGIDLAINFVLDADKNVVKLAAGKPSAVLESCASMCAKVYGVAIDQKFDIVVASCGGYPKDICLYQAQKGLNLASHALNPGGHILLLAASPQGVGDDIYFDYVSQFTSPEEVIRDFKSSGFRMGAHKAYLFGRTLVNYDVAVFSELDPGILRKCHLRAAEPAVIIAEWVSAFAGTPQVAIIPNANTTYFYESAKHSNTQIPKHQILNTNYPNTKRGGNMIQFLVHEEADNVGVATVDIKSGEKAKGLYMDSQKKVEVKALQDIPLGHKIALTKFKKDDSVIKYGHDIGRVVAEIKIGEHVHIHNLKTRRW